MVLLQDMVNLLGPVRRVHVPPLADDALACFADDASVVPSVFVVAIWKGREGSAVLMDDGRKSKEKISCCNCCHLDSRWHRSAGSALGFFPHGRFSWPLVALLSLFSLFILCIF